MNTNTLTMNRIASSAKYLLWAAALAAALLASSGVHAQGRFVQVRDDRGVHYDGRFAHNQYYHDRGYSLPGVPRGAYAINHGGYNYWYHGGEWYRHDGRFSIVVGAPLGAFVPVLPPFYSTVWWGGVPYYYADDTYYTWDSGQSQYQVVAPPSGIESGGTTAAPQSDQVFIYPKNGQPQAQQDQDRYECHRFAVGQTNYDPTIAGGGVQADQGASKRSDYLRAQAACLEGRGYSVK